MVAPAMRCLYVDLDGTLLGPGGSLVRAGDGRFSLDGVRALQACDRAGAEVVIYSGRRQRTVFEDSRLLGLECYIFEVGCGLVIDGELEWLTGGVVPSPEKGTIYEQIEASGAPKLLLERYARRLEYHTPWSRERDVSHLFRGLVDLDSVHALLRDEGLGWLRMLDNGVVHEHMAPLTAGQADVAIERTSGLRADLPSVRAYHLIPAAASKARAVARHMQIRGYAPADCVAVGDSREDLGASEAVGNFWLVANALERDPSLAAALSARVHAASGSYGAGVYEAVVTTLAEARG
jgi:hydroxymethylpyrimidine pyrophosphatase-like HAD family hydrolase